MDGLFTDGLCTDAAIGKSPTSAIFLKAGLSSLILLNLRPVAVTQLKASPNDQRIYGSLSHFVILVNYPFKVLVQLCGEDRGEE